MSRDFPMPADLPRDLRTILFPFFKNLLDGKTNNNGTVTLSSSSSDTTTTLTDTRIGPNTRILLMAATASAASALGGTYISATTGGSATITHAASTVSDRTFQYITVG